MFVLNYYSLPENTNKSFVCSRNNFYDALKKLTGKFKKVSLNETTEFSFWDQYTFVDLHQEIDNKERTKN